MKKIGILGGSFDPIHYGHIFLAEQAPVECSMEKILVIPAKTQPFKLDRPAAGGEHRLRMTQLAFAENPKIAVLDLELQGEEISYTIYTLRAVKEQYGEEVEVWFIAGADAFLKIEGWKDADEMLRDFSFVVGARPGYRRAELIACIDRLREVYNTNIAVINNKQTPISSTELKKRIEAGEDCSAFFPAAVERYIIANGLYRRLH